MALFLFTAQDKHNGFLGLEPKTLIEDLIGVLNVGQAHNAKRIENITSIKPIKSRGENLKLTKSNQNAFGNGFK